MQALYHRQVLQRALGARLSARALAAITRANLGQDSLSGLLNHPDYHFDDNLFAEGLKYIEDQRARAVSVALRRPAEAWAAFGRLSHAAQDFYSHSNYVALWMERITPHPAPAKRPIGKPPMGRGSPLPHLRSQPTAAQSQTEQMGEAGRGLPPIETIDGLDPDLLTHPRLRSGRVYWPVEALWILPPFRPLVKLVVPKDSHAWMNLDSPASGPLFPYSIEAAVQRTAFEFERTLALIGEEKGEEAVRRFSD